MIFFGFTDLKDCQGGHDCLGTEGVLRVSLGYFVSNFLLGIIWLVNTLDSRF